MGYCFPENGFTQKKKKTDDPCVEWWPDCSVTGSRGSRGQVEDPLRYCFLDNGFQKKTDDHGWNGGQTAVLQVAKAHIWNDGQAEGSTGSRDRVAEDPGCYR